jgi:hypothetical protein
VNPLQNHVDPFGLPGVWFKASLHIHTTASDGVWTPEEVIAWYRRRGYQVLALTDHGVCSQSQQLGDDCLLLGGLEVERVDPQSGAYHLVGLGMDRPPDLGAKTHLPLQEAVHRLRAAGGLVAAAHPYWTGQMSHDLLAVEGLFALEVYNGGCAVDDAKGYSTVHWDDLLAAGRRLWGLAVDDAHWRQGSWDAGLGWVWIKAPALTQVAILDALQRGHFYASSGPEILDLRWDASDGRVWVRCSPAVTIDFVGDGSKSRRVWAPPGSSFTEASHQPQPGQSYLRVACQDAQGGWAWSNPIFLNLRRGT